MNFGDFWLKSNNGKKYSLKDLKDLKPEDLAKNPKLQKFIQLFDLDNSGSIEVKNKNGQNEWESVFTELQDAAGKDFALSEEEFQNWAKSKNLQDIIQEDINDLFDLSIKSQNNNRISYSEISKNYYDEWSKQLEKETSIVNLSNYQKHEYTDSNTEIIEYCDEQNVYQRNLKVKDENNNVQEIIITFKNNKPLTQYEKINGKITQVREYSYNGNDTTIKSTVIDENGKEVSYTDYYEGDIISKRIVSEQDGKWNSLKTVVYYQNAKIIKQVQQKNNKTVSIQHYDYQKDENNPTISVISKNQYGIIEEIQSPSSKNIVYNIYSGNDLEKFSKDNAKRIQQVVRNGKKQEIINYDGKGNSIIFAQKDETNLEIIARKFGFKVADLLRVNPNLKQTTTLYIGQQILIPKELNADSPKLEKRESQERLLKESFNKVIEEIYSSRIVEYTISVDITGSNVREQAKNYLIKRKGLKQTDPDFNAKVEHLAQMLVILNGDNATYKIGDKVKFPVRSDDADKKLQELKSLRIAVNEKNQLFYTRFFWLNPQQQKNVIDVLKYCQQKGIKGTKNINAEITKYYPELQLFDKDYKPTKTEGRKYLAEMIYGQLYAIKSALEDTTVYKKNSPFKELAMEVDEWMQIGAEKLNNFLHSAAFLGIQNTDTRVTLTREVNKLYQKCLELTALVELEEKSKNDVFDKKQYDYKYFEEAFDKLFAEITGKKVNYQNTSEYMILLQQYENASDNDKNNPKSAINQKLKANAKKLEAIPTFQNLENKITNYTNYVEKTGGLMDLAFNVLLMYCSGGIGNSITAFAGTAAEKQTASYMARAASTKFGQSAVGKVLVGDTAKSVVSSFMGQQARSLVNAPITAGFFMGTKFIEAGADGIIDIDDLKMIGESWKGLTEFTYLSHNIAAPAGAVVKNLMANAAARKSVLYVISGATKTPQTLKSVITALAKNSDKMATYSEFATTFGLNAEIMAVQDGMSYVEAMKNLGEMDAVSKMVVSMVSRKNMKFPQPNQVRKVVEELEKYKVEDGKVKKSNIEIEFKNEDELAQILAIFTVIEAAKAGIDIRESVNKGVNEGVKPEASPAQPKTEVKPDSQLEQVGAVVSETRQNFAEISNQFAQKHKSYELYSDVESVVMIVPVAGKRPNAAAGVPFTYDVYRFDKEGNLIEEPKKGLSRKEADKYKLKNVQYVENSSADNSSKLNSFIIPLPKKIRELVFGKNIEVPSENTVDNLTQMTYEEAVASINEKLQVACNISDIMPLLKVVQEKYPRDIIDDQGTLRFDDFHNEISYSIEFDGKGNVIRFFTIAHESIDRKFYVYDSGKQKAVNIRDYVKIRPSIYSNKTRKYIITNPHLLPKEIRDLLLQDKNHFYTKEDVDELSSMLKTPEDIAIVSKLLKTRGNENRAIRTIGDALNVSIQKFGLRDIIKVLKSKEARDFVLDKIAQNKYVKKTELERRLGGESFDSIIKQCKFTDEIDTSYRTKDITLNKTDDVIKEYQTNPQIREQINQQVPNGEAACINGKMYCRADNILVPINLDKATFDRLFPVEERYNIKQGSIGDCYFIAELGGYAAIPNGRAALYSSFSQEGNDIIIKFPSFDNIEIRFENGELNKLYPISIYKHEGHWKIGSGDAHVRACDGIKMIEQAYSFVRNNYIEDNVQIIANDKFLMNKQMQELDGGHRDGGGDVPSLFGNYEPIGFYKNGKVRNEINRRSAEEVLDILAKELETDPNVFGSVGFVEDISIELYQGLMTGHMYRIVGYDKNTQIVKLVNPHDSNIYMEIPLELFKAADPIISIYKIKAPKVDGVNEDAPLTPAPSHKGQGSESTRPTTLSVEEGVNEGVNKGVKPEETANPQLEQQTVKANDEVSSGIEPELRSDDVGAKRKTTPQGLTSEEDALIQKARKENPAGIVERNIFKQWILDGLEPAQPPLLSAQKSNETSRLILTGDLIKTLINRYEEMGRVFTEIAQKRSDDIKKLAEENPKDIQVVAEGIIKILAEELGMAGFEPPIVFKETKGGDGFADWQNGQIIISTSVINLGHLTSIISHEFVHMLQFRDVIAQYGEQGLRELIYNDKSIAENEKEDYIRAALENDYNKHLLESYNFQKVQTGTVDDYLRRIYKDEFTNTIGTDRMREYVDQVTEREAYNLGSEKLGERTANLEKINITDWEVEPTEIIETENGEKIIINSDGTITIRVSDTSTPASVDSSDRFKSLDKKEAKDLLGARQSSPHVLNSEYLYGISARDENPASVIEGKVIKRWLLDGLKEPIHPPLLDAARSNETSRLIFTGELVNKLCKRYEEMGKVFEEIALKHSVDIKRLAKDNPRNRKAVAEGIIKILAKELGMEGFEPPVIFGDTGDVAGYTNKETGKIVISKDIKSLESITRMLCHEFIHILQYRDVFAQYGELGIRDMIESDQSIPDDEKEVYIKTILENKYNKRLLESYESQKEQSGTVKDYLIRIYKDELSDVQTFGKNPQGYFNQLTEREAYYLGNGRFGHSTEGLTDIEVRDSRYKEAFTSFIKFLNTPHGLDIADTPAKSDTGTPASVDSSNRFKTIDKEEAKDLLEAQLEKIYDKNSYDFDQRVDFLLYECTIDEKISEELLNITLDLLKKSDIYDIRDLINQLVCKSGIDRLAVNKFNELKNKSIEPKIISKILDACKDKDGNFRNDYFEKIMLLNTKDYWTAKWVLDSCKVNDEVDENIWVKALELKNMGFEALSIHSLIDSCRLKNGWELNEFSQEIFNKIIELKEKHAISLKAIPDILEQSIKNGIFNENIYNTAIVLSKHLDIDDLGCAADTLRYCDSLETAIKYIDEMQSKYNFDKDRIVFLYEALCDEIKDENGKIILKFNEDKYQKAVELKTKYNIDGRELRQYINSCVVNNKFNKELSDKIDIFKEFGLDDETIRRILYESVSEYSKTVNFALIDKLEALCKLRIEKTEKNPDSIEKLGEDIKVWLDMIDSTECNALDYIEKFENAGINDRLRDLLRDAWLLDERGYSLRPLMYDTKILDCILNLKEKYNISEKQIVYGLGSIRELTPEQKTEYISNLYRLLDAGWNKDNLNSLSYLRTGGEFDIGKLDYFEKYLKLGVSEKIINSVWHSCTNYDTESHNFDKIGFEKVMDIVAECPKEYQEKFAGFVYNMVEWSDIILDTLKAKKVSIPEYYSILQNNICTADRMHDAEKKAHIEIILNAIEEHPDKIEDIKSIITSYENAQDENYFSLCFNHLEDNKYEDIIHNLGSIRNINHKKFYMSILKQLDFDGIDYNHAHIVLKNLIGAKYNDKVISKEGISKLKEIIKNGYFKDDVDLDVFFMNLHLENPECANVIEELIKLEQSGYDSSDLHFMSWQIIKNDGFYKNYKEIISFIKNNCNDLDIRDIISHYKDSYYNAEQELDIEPLKKVLEYADKYCISKVLTKIFSSILYKNTEEEVGTAFRNIVNFFDKVDFEKNSEIIKMLLDECGEEIINPKLTPQQIELIIDTQKILIDKKPVGQKEPQILDADFIKIFTEANVSEEALNKILFYIDNAVTLPDFERINTTKLNKIAHLYTLRPDKIEFFEDLMFNNKAYNSYELFSNFSTQKEVLDKQLELVEKILEYPGVAYAKLEIANVIALNDTIENINAKVDAFNTINLPKESIAEIKKKMLKDSYYQGAVYNICRILSLTNAQNKEFVTKAWNNLSNIQIESILGQISEKNYDLANILYFDKEINFPHECIPNILSKTYDGKNKDLALKLCTDKSLKCPPDKVVDIIDAIQFINVDIKSLSLSQKINTFGTISSMDKTLLNLYRKYLPVDIDAKIAELAIALGKKKDIINVSASQQREFLQNILANNNKTAETVLKNFDFAQYGKQGLPLKYTREQFTANIEILIKDLSPEEQLVILEHFGLIRGSAGFDGLPTNKPFNNENASPQVNEIAQKVQEEIEKFTARNQINTGDATVDNVLNGLIKGLPEFTSIVGKEQHGKHAYSVDIHTLKVLQSAMNNPLYERLSDKDKTILKIAALCHDLGKRGGVVDKGHASSSAEYVTAILDKFPFPRAMKDRIIDIVDNHHWFEAYNTRKATAEDVAVRCRRPEDFMIYEILAKADFENVNKDFHISLSEGVTNQAEFDKFMQDKMEAIDEALTRMYSRANLVFDTQFVLNGERFPRQTVEIDGEITELKVLNLNDLKENDSLQQYGFSTGVTKESARFTVHMTEPVVANMESVMILTQNSLNQSAWSTSLIKASNNRTYCNRKFGFVLEVDQANISEANYENIGSGYEKGLETFKQILFNEYGSTRTYVKDHLIKELSKKGVELNDDEYAKLSRFLVAKKYTTQIRKNIKIGDKIIDAKILTECLEKSRDALFEGGDIHSEIVPINPRVKGLIAKVDKLEDCPKEFLEFAKKYNLPIIIMRPQSKR